MEDMEKAEKAEKIEGDVDHEAFQMLLDAIENDEKAPPEELAYMRKKWEEQEVKCYGKDEYVPPVGPKPMSKWPWEKDLQRQMMGIED